MTEQMQKREDTEHHLGSLTVDWSPLCPNKEWHPPLLQLFHVILQCPCLSTRGTPGATWEPWALPVEPPCRQLFSVAAWRSLPLYSETDKKNTSLLKVSMGTFHHRPHRWHGCHRQVDIFYYSQCSKAVRAPRRSLQRLMSEVTSNRQGLGDSRRLRHCRANSLVHVQGSLLWRHRWDQKRSPSNTGQHFDPITARIQWGIGFYEWGAAGKGLAVILDFRGKSWIQREAGSNITPIII